MGNSAGSEASAFEVAMVAAFAAVVKPAI